MENSQSTARNRLVFCVADTRHEIDADLVLEVVRASHLTRVPNGPQALKGIANFKGRPVPVVSMSFILNGFDSSSINDGKMIVYDHGQIIGLLVDEVLRLSSDDSATPVLALHEILEMQFKSSRRTSDFRLDRISRNTEIAVPAETTALLSFRASGQLYGLPLEHVREVVALGDAISAFPGAGQAVVGVVAIRDISLPLLSLASLMGLETDQVDLNNSRVIVVANGADLIGLVVDEIDVIHRLAKEHIDPVPAVLQRGRGEGHIEAVGRISNEGLLIAILSPEKLFTHHSVSHAVSQTPGARGMEKTLAPQATEQFLIFQLGDENYGLPVGAVDEVLRLPEEITRLPGAPEFVLGVANVRGKAVPMIDQRRRFEASASLRSKRARAIIVTMSALQVGFVVDSVSEVKAIPTSALSSTPELSAEQDSVFDRIAHLESDGSMILLIDPRQLLSRTETDLIAALAIGKPGGD
jgi:purine-binding chemotaxis protein CheW